MNRLAIVVPLLALPTLANADLIFGMNSPVSGAGIYLINTATGASTLYRATPTAASSGGNGLAYDPSTDNFYYVANAATGLDRIIRCGPSGETDLGPVTTSAPIASGTFYNGSYWYQPNNEARVYRATFPTPSSVSITFQILPGFPTTSSFGDIASLPDGTTYASFSGDMRRYDLDVPGAGSVPLASASVTLQLAFHGTTLWGISGSDQIYSVNTLNGFASPGPMLLNTSLNILDAATVPAPASALTLGALAVLRRRRR